MVNDVFDGSVSGKCTLRDAVATANNQGTAVNGCTTSGTGSNTIVFDSTLSGQIIDVKATPGHIEITSNLIINAPAGGITLDAKSSSISGPPPNRIFEVTGGTSLSITGVRFINGNASSSWGGAIEVDTINHTLTLENCAFVNNQANFGGAVWTGGSATISNSSFEDNQAAYGGAVYAYTATISNSSFVGNQAAYGGAVYAYITLDARHLTLLGNSVDSPGVGRALYVHHNQGSGGSATLHNSIIIGTDNNDAAQCAGNVTFTGSYNLEGYVDTSNNWQPTAAVTTCGSASPVTASVGTSLSTIINPALVNNGGPTPTLALPAGSPAIAAADPSGSTSQMWDFSTSNWTDATLDQRGYLRSVIALKRDIGAYENRRTLSPIGSGTPIPALPAPLLLALAAAAGLLGRKRLRRI